MFTALLFRNTMLPVVQLGNLFSAKSCYIVCSLQSSVAGSMYRFIAADIAADPLDRLPYRYLCRDVAGYSI